MAKNPTGLAVDKELKTTDLSPKIILNSFLLTLELHERQPERRAVRSVGATWLLITSSIEGDSIARIKENGVTTERRTGHMEHQDRIEEDMERDDGR